MQIPESQWDVEAFLQYKYYIYSYTVCTESVAQNVLFGPCGAGRQFPSFQLCCSPAKGEFWIPLLASGIVLCKVMWKVLQARTGIQASLYSLKFPTLLKSCSLFCVISVLFITGLINSSVCSSMVTRSVQKQNRKLAVARVLLLIIMWLKEFWIIFCRGP